MNVAIIKHNAGNIYSVESALKRLNISPVVTDDKNLILNADKVIFPGVGEASSTMGFLKENKLDLLVKELKQPVLGICLGMQLMCSHSEEGDVDCLNIFDVDVRRFSPLQKTDKVPHMGWNSINKLKSPLFDSIPEDEFVYFVHSFYVPVNSYTIATTDHIQPFSAALNKNSFYATQFHPEKSGSVGERILINFLNL